MLDQGAPSLSNPRATCHYQLRRKVVEYQIDANIIPNIFLHNTDYKLSTSMLLERVRTSLRLTVLRFLPDILAGHIQLDNPGAFVELASQVCRE